ncbi:phosphatase PAP2 family protein [Gordonia asplenii]|nr:phosphatase PAP2 family protein [Gordonia asplenii]
MDTALRMGQTGPDVDVYRWVTQHRGEPWISVARVLTLLGTTIVLTVLTLVVVLALAATRRCSTAVLVGVGSVSGYVLMVALKDVFGRERPPVADRLLKIDSNSFPSGHAMMTAICFGLFAVSAYYCSAWLRRHAWVLALAPVLSVLVGCTRVYLGVHWMTDVLAGWVIGALWVVLCVAAWRRLTRR